MKRKTINKDAVRKMAEDYPSMTLQEIGDKFGCTREYVRQIASGVRDVKLAFFLRSEERVGDLLNRPPDPDTSLRVVWDAAVKLGYSVERVMREGWGLSSELLKINGVTVFVAECRVSWRWYSRPYIHVVVNQKGLPWILAYMPPGGKRRLFMFPRNLTPRKTLFIPLEPLKVPYHNRLPKIDWLQYENAWWVIDEAKSKLDKTRENS
jgi:hypothetical protein